MNWVLDIALPLIAVLLVVVPKLSRSILFESLFHPFGRTEIQVRDSHIYAVHK